MEYTTLFLKVAGTLLFSGITVAFFGVISVLLYEYFESIKRKK